MRSVSTRYIPLLLHPRSNVGGGEPPPTCCRNVYNWGVHTTTLSGFIQRILFELCPFRMTQMTKLRQYLDKAETQIFYP